MKTLLLYLLIVSITSPFSKTPIWLPVEKEYQIELTNIGDMPLEIYSIELSKGVYTSVDKKTFTIDSASMKVVTLLASKCVDTITIYSNSVPDSIHKVLFKYHKLKILK